MRQRLGLLSLAGVLVAAPALEAQPEIQTVGLECIAPGTFAVVLSGIDPEGEIQTAKVYFRSSLYPDFYYVEMRREEDRFIAVLPQPSSDTPKVVYYVEAVDLLFNSSRSAEFDPVVGACKKRPEGAYIPGDDPGIIVGAVASGAPAIPPGFSAAGIIGTITAAGVSAGVSGGIGAGTAIASAAAAAGVTGAVVATKQGSSSASTSTIVAAPPSSVPTTTTTVVSGPGPTTSVPRPSSTTTTVPPTTTVGSTTTTTAATTTTSTGSSSTTSSALPALNPDCFTVQSTGTCKVTVNATCVNPPVDRYDWILDVTDEWNKVNEPNAGASFTYKWDDDDCDSSTTMTFQLTVTRGGSTATATKTFFVAGDLKAESASPPTSVRFRTLLGLPPFDGRARGEVVLNGQLVRNVDNAQPAEISGGTSQKTNTLEATVVSGGSAEGIWRFDFPSEPTPDNVRVLEGNVLALDSKAVVFRLSGRPGERVRFQFSLAR